MEGWRELLVAGLGGGAIHAISDSLLSKFVPAGEVFGVTFKDIALIFLGKWGSERVGGDLSTALKGMAVIALYKSVYPKFVQPLISGLKFGSSSSSSSSNSAEAMAKAYVLAQGGSI